MGCIIFLQAPLIRVVPYRSESIKMSSFGFVRFVQRFGFSITHLVFGMARIVVTHGHVSCSTCLAWAWYMGDSIFENTVFHIARYSWDHENGKALRKTFSKQVSSRKGCHSELFGCCKNISVYRAYVIFLFQWSVWFGKINHKMYVHVYI